MGLFQWFRRRRRSRRYSHRKVKRRARRDGRPWAWTIWPFREDDRSIPPLDQERPADFERTLRESAEDDLATIAGWWQEDDEALREEYCDAREEYEQARDAERQEAREASEARKAFELAKEEYFSFEPPDLDHRWMYFWLGLIGVGEFFLNATVFQVLGGGRWETYVAALAVGVAIPILGHWTGHQLRQEDKGVIDWSLLGLVPLVLFAGLYGLAVLRGRFAEAAGEQIQRIFGVQFSSDEFMMIFLLLNILLFFVATVCAFAASHPQAGRFRRAWRKYRSAKKELGKESSEAEAAADRLERAQKRLQKARNRREKEYQRRRQEVIDQRQTYAYWCQVYRTENLRAREDGRPACFDREIPVTEVELPAALRSEELEDWDCEDLGAHRPAGVADAGGATEAGDEEAEAGARPSTSGMGERGSGRGEG